MNRNPILPFFLISLMLFALIPTQSTSLEPTSDQNQTNGRAIACTSDVCINEILPNPNGYDNDTYPNGEWLELFNSGSTDIDLTGWSVTNSASKSLTFDSASIVGYLSSDSQTWTISPNEYVVIARNGNSNFWMTNTADSISLLDASSSIVDEASWGSSASSGISFEEDSSNPTGHWIATGQPTPGQQNNPGGPVTYIPSDLIIHEIMANPWPSDDNASYPGGEWIEVFNSGTTSIDLTGWSIVDAAGNILNFDQNHVVGASSEPSSMMIKGGEYRLIAVNSTGSYGVLNNGVESITLKWPNGSNAQTVEWSSTIAGFSMYNSSTSSLWTSLSTYPTPNSSNAPSLNSIINPNNDIILNELLPNSTVEPDIFPDGEWIELHNQGTMDIDLMGWSIIDGMGNVTYLDPGTLVFNATQGSTIIQPNEYRIVQLSGDTRLWDDYNHLVLLDATQTPVDGAWYTADYGQDVALERDSTPTDPWVPAPWKTPGQPAPGSTPSSATIRISEILPDALGSDSQTYPNGEWIELENFGSTDIDVANWKLQATGRSFTLHEYNFPLQSNSIIKAGQVALIALNGTSSFYLKHTSPDSFGLLEPSGATVDTASWNMTVEGESLVRSNSSHAGLQSIYPVSVPRDDFVKHPWPTPNQLNPEWGVYAGSRNLTVTEIYPYCPNSDHEPSEDWVEVLNTGTEIINISRWKILDSDGDYSFIIDQNIWSNESNPTTEVEPGQRLVLMFDPWTISGLGDEFSILDPDHAPVEEVTWDEVTECQSLAQIDDEWRIMPWITPGYEEPDLSNIASYSDILLTRIMPDASTSVDGDMEFLEITNKGTQIASLQGWTLRHISTAGTPFNTTIQSLMIAPQSSAILASDVSSLSVYETGTMYAVDQVLNRTMYFGNSGAALQLEDLDGNIADAIVYGNGPTESNGWNGISVVEPFVGLSNLIYVRGDGCGSLPDTNTSVDWYLRWQILGGSAHCGARAESGSFDITPLIGPDSGIHDVLKWINEAEESLHLHVYQFHSNHLAQALMDAHDRGVHVHVVLDAGDTWWNDYDLDQHKGVAATLSNYGIDVQWFGTSSEVPYAYLHSKIAVRDNTSVWVSSGNWKSSSLPADGDSGNREWSMLLDNEAFADIVLQHLSIDEDERRTYLTPVDASDMPIGWTLDQPEPLVGQTSSPIVTTATAELLVCPDVCINGLVDMLNGADEEILLSLQYLDLDWSYGWGENPIIEALQSAALRGVQIRLILNGAFLDEDIQSTVDLFNEEWNASLGYDTSAIIMATNDTISKLHNKGAIIDGQQVLISSINWGDSALIRNREMGVIVTSEDIAQIYRNSWLDDWNLLSDDVDTDLDNLGDKWEEEQGLHRTRRTVLGETYIESEADPDGDGLLNLAEFQYKSNPLSNDTDNDCIPDGLELQWSQAMTRDTTTPSVDPHTALTSADADGNGILDSEEFGCDLLGFDLESNETQTNETLDEDGDGVADAEDRCPSSPIGTLVNANGCTSDQQAELSLNDGQQGAERGNSMLYILIASLIFLVGAFGIYSSTKKKNMGTVDYIESENQPHQAEAMHVVDVEQKEWVQPVLDGTVEEQASSDVNDSTVEEMKEPTSAQMAILKGWTVEMVEQYIAQGWSMDQLIEYYENQVVENQT